MQWIVCSSISLHLYLRLTVVAKKFFGKLFEITYDRTDLIKCKSIATYFSFYQHWHSSHPNVLGKIEKKIIKARKLKVSSHQDVNISKAEQFYWKAFSCFWKLKNSDENIDFIIFLKRICIYPLQRFISPLSFINFSPYLCNTIKWNWKEERMKSIHVKSNYW